VALVGIGLVAGGAMKYHAKLTALLSKPKPALDIHPLSADEIKAQCAHFSGTDYVCVPGLKFQQGQTPDEVQALCSSLGSDCTIGPKGVLSKLKRSIPVGNKPRDVYVSTFAMRRDLVTCQEYASFLRLLRGRPGWQVLLETDEYVSTAGRRYKRKRYPSFDGQKLYDLYATGACIVYDEKTQNFSVKRGLARRPVEHTSWFGASTYCAQEEQASLPTEAQFARVRQSAGTLYPNGSLVTPPCRDIAYGQILDHGVFPLQRGECESLDAREKGARDVGSSTSDVIPGFGIHDLSGNVSEWARDGFVEHLSPCAGGVCVDPVEPPQADTHRVMAGGAYTAPRWFMYSTTRGQYEDWKMDPSNGFRCVKP
jgi:formylglycine-generating enzyme required for sulfatase activity